MKALVISLVILCSVILSTVLISIHTNKLLSSIGNAIDEKLTNDCSTSIKGAKELSDKYNDAKLFFTLFMRDTEIREIEMYISDAQSAAEKNDHAGLLTAKNRLKLHIDQLRRLYAFSIEAIF